jgi:uncharacterized protein
MNTSESPVDVKVAGLFSYPVKGCRAIAHAQANVLVSGLCHDREWMVVDVRRTPAQFLSQRECALMATVTVAVSDDGGLLLTSGAADQLVVPPPARNALLKVKVWSHDTVALDAGDAAGHWLTGVLAMPQGSLRLVRFHTEMRRDCNRLYAGDAGAHTFFADGYPLLVTNVASLADLHLRMRRATTTANALTMDRFRPNLVIEGLPAWDEDHIDTISVGEAVLKLVKPCVRCQVTTTDQTSGARLSDEPLRTLATFRNNPALGGVTFGWNAVVLKAGRVCFGEIAAAEYRF